MKTTLFLTLMLLGNGLLHAQALAEWSFENLTSAVPRLPIPASYLASEIVTATADMSGGNNIGSPSVCSGRTWATNFWPTANHSSLDAYLAFTVKAKPKQALRIAGFSYSSGISSSSGPKNYDVYVWPDGIPILISSGSNGAGGCGSGGATYEVDVPEGGSITFSIHPYGQNPAAMAATMRVDNVSIVGSAILPIQLLGFSAKRLVDHSVELSWQTASELNNDFVAIERSSHLPDFLEIGRIPGEGNSNELRNYVFHDRLLLPGPIYFRLRQVDYDGAEHISNVVAIDGENNGIPALLAYPSPAQERLYLRGSLISANNEATLSIIDTRGIIVISDQLSAQAGTWEVDVAALPSGVYVAMINSGAQVLQQRFYKQ
jgi:hypothetical protein